VPNPGSTELETSHLLTATTEITKATKAEAIMTQRTIFPAALRQKPVMRPM